MKVRLENLCVGAKGYTFNTNEYLDFEEILNKNTVFELEGLADDSDKAFSVGLLVIFINEYRQVEKELQGQRTTGLRHLLVIEEAHRLLKNIDTERVSEDVGNSKGKAVEHFTNMIAEMRSYGQGVIVAEQIPTKLAPDVIKNSSTKIVQRIVAADDQRTISNTIGIPERDAIQLGILETGYAYCHKEGMALPVPVKISGLKDIYVDDGALFNQFGSDRSEKIDLCVMRSSYGGDEALKRCAIGFLNTLMAESESNCIEGAEAFVNHLSRKIEEDGTLLLLTGDNLLRVKSNFLAGLVIGEMLQGVYGMKDLPEDGFLALMEDVLYLPTAGMVCNVKNCLQNYYGKNTAGFAITTVAALVKRSLKKDTDIDATVREYFLSVSGDTVNKIIKNVQSANR